MSGIEFCPYCGEYLEGEDGDVCPHCGEEIEG